MNKFKFIVGAAIIGASLSLLNGTEVFAATNGKVVNVSTGLNVRSNPNINSNVLISMNPNDTFEILGKQGEWYNVKYKNVIGYAHKNYIREIDAIPTSGITSLKYSHSFLNIRSGAGTNYSILGELKNNTVVNILGQSGNWYKINYNNIIGYVSKDYIKNYTNNSSSSSSSNSFETRIGYVSVSGSNSALNVRSGAGTNHAIVGTLSLNSKVTITNKVNEWYKISSNGLNGYVHSRYISSNPVTIVEDSYSTTYNKVLSAMKAQIGSPYVWGGAGETLNPQTLNVLKKRFPSQTAKGYYSYIKQSELNGSFKAFDCSGLMQWGFKQAGINLTRTTYTQVKEGIAVSRNNLKPGDLLFTKNLGHVGMYVGNNKWLESPVYGKHIRIVDVPWHNIGQMRRVIK